MQYQVYAVAIGYTRIASVHLFFKVNLKFNWEILFTIKDGPDFSNSLRTKRGAGPQEVTIMTVQVAARHSSLTET